MPTKSRAHLYVTGGLHRRRELFAPPDLRLRPSSSRLRESLFNVFHHRYDHLLQNGRVLDLFAGTGALGIEALSRGAEHVVFVEKDPDAAELVRWNLQMLGEEKRAEVWERDVSGLEKRASSLFSLVFCDPPYRTGGVEIGLNAVITGGWLCQNGLFVAKEARETQVAVPPQAQVIETRFIGETRLIFARVTL